MRTGRLAIAAASAAYLAVAAGFAEEPGAGQATQATLEVLVDTIRANRKALVAVNLDLSDDEAARFWPVYDRYQRESNAVGDRLVALIEDYSTNFRRLSDQKARKIVEDYLAIEADRVAVRRSYLGEFAGVLPGRKLARFYQIENKMDAVLRYDLAATIPVVEDK
jgi:hypothetical protein